MERKKLWTQNFVFLALSNFFMFTSFYMMLPTLPVFVVDVLKGTSDQVGLIIGFFTTAQIFSRPLAGKWLDDFGRKKIFLWSRLIFLVVMVGYLGISGLFLFLALRFIHGFSFGLATTASGTMVADLIPAQRRAEGLGYYSGFASLALVLGPSVGLWIMNLSGFTVMFAVCSVLAAISVLLGSFIHYPEKKTRQKEEKAWSWNRFIEPKAIPIAVISVLLLSVYGGMVSFISLFAQELGIVAAAGYFFSVYSVALLISRPVTGKISDRYGTDYVIYPGMILCILGILILSQAHSTLLFLLAALLIGFGFGSIQPSLHAMVIQSVPAERRGAATATYFISNDVGIASGAFVLGIISNWVGYSSMFLSTTLLVVISIIWYGIYQKKHREYEMEARKQNVSGD
ncbi:MFS transporter [Kroppenstedtia pulmonis]|uniref:MFS transporter n=1 Tax=Kroppenstedtia pulmonis TaxID=1380685 RepID=A0A7D3XJS3_9BACL|nr:MFS transporter [Kroppenstedtia pulmonis]QKG85364.1 MFS transporter [Kroppenstedtia pulmonis]